MDRLKKWLGRYFELLAQKVLAEPVQAEMLAALQAVAMDVVHVGAGENTISDAARAKVEAVLEKLGAPWPGPAAAPAAPAVDATSDTALLDAMQRHRIALVPEFEGPWDAEIYDDDAEARHIASGNTPREALRAAIAAQAKEGGEA
ncbi:hypothetical protein [Delftia tsuruhatensis]|uniref:hypothetical protein n=1 Tax=Delftia tsuruhatensis TaxID=180282 RepID=UPI002AD366E5|nr:hypothetical protein [Delftia tsuruhatensis]WQM81737.1 hypothetical protein RNT40_23965 [Delftia tsuruhatensis]